MKRFVQLIVPAVVLLLLGTGAANGQEVTYSSGPAVTPVGVPGANGGFAWGDVLGNGNLDIFIPSNIIMLNNNSSFAVAASTMTANIPTNTNTTPVLLADFNGDGFPDILSTNAEAISAGLLYNSPSGVFTPATGIGDLATAGNTGEVFIGATVADINHSGYLSIAYPGQNETSGAIPANGNPSKPNGGVWLLKGGPSGFTNEGRNAAPSNVAIDTSLTFESWNPMFLDANNDGYPDLLMPSFRNAFARIDSGISGSRKGTVLYMNDGTGKFYVPTSAKLAGNPTIYSFDTAGTYVPKWILGYQGNDSVIAYYWDSLYRVVGTAVDTGIIVDDTVRHFEALSCIVGDFNNDGNPDLILASNGANNLDGNGRYVNVVLLYGNGDGTFTYKWNGTTVVPNNGLPYTTYIRAWAAGDYNNDGWEDVLTAAGGANTLLRNNGNGTFTDETVADNVAAPQIRAVGFVDYNNDGFLDIFTQTAGTAAIQKNNGNSNHWIGFIPVGAGNNTSAIGARFTVYTGGGTTKQIRTITADAAAQGTSDVRANFGLGSTTTLDSVAVVWPDGVRQTWSGTKLAAGAAATTVVNKYWKIVEGSDVPAAPVQIRPSFASKDTALTNIDTLSWNAAAAGTCRKPGVRSSSRCKRRLLLNREGLYRFDRHEHHTATWLFDYVLLASERVPVRIHGSLVCCGYFQHQVSR